MHGITRRDVLKQVGICATASMVLGLDSVQLKAEEAVAPQGAALAPWAAQRFLTHWNCSQAVLESFAKVYNLDVAMAQKLSTGRGLFTSFCPKVVEASVNKLQVLL